MSLERTLAVSGSALAAQRLRADLASSNLANAESTRTPEGGPYRRKDAVFEAASLEPGFGGTLEQALRGVRVREIRSDPAPPREVLNPSHPDADERGMVKLPNVNVIEELVNLRGAQRSYEANLQAISVAREMAMRALRLGRSG